MRNLTELSLKNRVLVWYFIIITFIGGIFAYVKLGRMEDPEFTIRQMIVTAAWPGATADQMQEQVTDKLERKFQDVKNLDYVKSYSRAGSTVIYVTMKQGLTKDEYQAAWKTVRNFGSDITKDLPTGVYGPYYNDHFEDVYGSIYAITGEGFDYEELRQQAEKLRRTITNLPNIQKVELLGEQPEKIYIEMDRAKLMELGISPQAVSEAIKAQNQMTATGEFETSSDNVYVRVSGVFTSVEDIKNVPITAKGRVLRLQDIARVERKFVSPMEPAMYYNGKPAIGIAASMIPGGNILELGKNLDKVVAQAQEEVPLGMEIGQVSNQPQVVEESISDFVHTLFEAVVIVLAVSFLSLGVRTGMVVAGCIPLVLAGVFTIMYLIGIDLHKVSLGALIISLGLLVDDAIIAVEMMSVKLEQGYKRFDAACYAFNATAKPMLTGTLITCSGFIPVAFSKGMASEFCNALFPVVGTALVLSWIVSVMVAPLFGYHLIKVKVETDAEGKADPYQSRFYGYFRQVLEWFLNHRVMVLAATLAVFVASLGMMTKVKQEFFPSSLRPELILNMYLPEGSSKEATAAEAEKMSQFLTEHQDEIENYSYYVGEGAPRFVLTSEPVLPADNFVQFVVVANDTETREKLNKAMTEALADQFPNVRSNIKYIQTGPPAAYPVMVRVSGYDKDKVRLIAERVGARIAENPNITGLNYDWREKSKIMHLELDQDKLRSMGLTSQNISQMMYTELNGATAAQFYTGDRTIDIQLRMAEADRNDLSQLKSLPIYMGDYGYVPLEQVAKISYEAEDGLIWRYKLQPSITVQADIISGTANDATKQALQEVKDITDSLPLGYSIQAEGALHDSEEATQFLLTPLPAMIFAIMTLLMFQLRSVKQMIITIVTAPLGIIGVAWGMLLLDKAMGFVALLGVLALCGMIIRNTVILIDQIQKHMADGEKPWDAIVDSAIMRFRPIMLTAAAAILGMLPLMPSTFWGPMAVAIASGLIVATVLTLLVVPVLYAVVYKVKRE